MVQLAAVCTRCHRPFPSGLAFAPGTSATMVGNRSGPCPWCGNAWGVIPDGLIEVDANVAVRLSQALPTTSAELLTLAGILHDLGTDATIDQLVERITAELPPDSANRLATVLRDPMFANVGALIGVLLALLAFLGVKPL